MKSLLPVFILACFFQLSCSDESNVITVEPAKLLLSEYGLLKNNNGKLSPLRGMQYEINTSLFSDYALKFRTMYIPPNLSATYKQDSTFEFPVGTIFTKSFSFPQNFDSPNENVNVIETRLLIKEKDKWRALPYIWNKDGSDAEISYGGKRVKDNAFRREGNEVTHDYLVPSANQCQQCHHSLNDDKEEIFILIGPKARNLNRDNQYNGQNKNQLQHMLDIGYLSSLPNISEVDKLMAFTNDVDIHTLNMNNVKLNAVARGYLDVNCAHCHNPKGTIGVSSQLFLHYKGTDRNKLGYCKQPGSAGPGGKGRTYDIVPGDPENSILHHRIDTTDANALMPTIGRSLRHTEGVNLINAWITSLTPKGCP